MPLETSITIKNRHTWAIGQVVIRKAKLKYRDYSTKEHELVLVLEMVVPPCSL
jgi:hypothetical protein